MAHTRAPCSIWYTADRSPGTLDSALLAQARESGADVRLGVRRHEAGPGTIVATGSDRADGLAPGFTFHTSCPTWRTPWSTVSWHRAATLTS